MTKEEVLQEANKYCNEKSYNETLTSEFKEKFSEFFAKKYPEAKADDETMLEDLHFNLNTAFSATSKGVTHKQKEFDEKKKELEDVIADLKKKQSNEEPKFELPDDVKQQLKELETFKKEEKAKDKLKEVLSLAKKDIRQDLHKSFENYALDYNVNVEESSEEQAKKLVSRFQEIFKDSIGDIKPLAPQQVKQREDDFLESIKSVTIKN